MLFKAFFQRESLGYILYVHSKFVQQEAAGIYYIPWPAKKLLPKFLTQVCLPEKA